jgi:hypothetical protein
MNTNETQASASPGGDWHDRTPIEINEREHASREETARTLLDADQDERLPKSGGGWAPVASIKRDTDLVGRVMLSTIKGTALADTDPSYIIAAMNLIVPVRRDLDRLESQLMMIGRRQGMSWRAIAEALGLMSPQAAAQRWERLTGAVTPDVGVLRRRVTSALLDSRITRADAKVFVGGNEGRTVILQLAAHGPAEIRQHVAARIVEALRQGDLGITDEGSHSEADMVAYLANGGTAEVFDLGERASV